MSNEQAIMDAFIAQSLVILALKETNRELLEALKEMVAGDKEAIEEAELMGVPFPKEMLATYEKACTAILKAEGAPS